MADPVAAFLEREQGIFGDLDDEPVMVEHQQQHQPPAADIPQIEVAPFQANGIVNGNNDSGVDLAAFVESNHATPAPIITNGRSISPSASERSDGEPIFQAKPEVEPDSVRKWRKEYEDKLTKLDSEEQKIMKDLKEQAKKELADFEKRRASDLEQRKKFNREKQVEFLKNVEKASAGVLWQRIAKVVENDERTPKNPIDTDRMRQLLLQCKDGGPKPVNGTD
uniref:Clathrin light chain n=1 Tax=Panagrolaimus sp. ES5 TaxID=591445 RepID=A0AC34FWH2_9BILA